MVQFNGHFDGNVIMPDERVEIPVNTPLRVTIERVTKEGTQPVEWARLIDLARECAVEGPEHLAERHDHYVHGKPME